MSLGRALVIAAAASAFLVVSFLVARLLTQDSRERGAVTDLLRAQARGDVAGMLRRLEGCEDELRCREAVERNARRLRRPGDLRILRYDSSTARAVASRTGPTRVAWNDGSESGRVVVQCVTVRRSGLSFVGGEITLSAIGYPIEPEAPCPR